MHHAAWLLAPLTLIGVLTSSAVPKLGKGATLRKIIRNLDLPDWILPEPLARAIPGIELALAVGLLAPWVPLFAVAAGASLVLMLVYWTLIARGLTLHPRPSCGCFGQAGDHQISGRTLVRNTLLVSAAFAALALALSGRSVWSLVLGASSGDWLWLGLAALACVVTGLVLGGVSTTPWRANSTSAAPEHAQPARSPKAADSADDDYVRIPTPNVLLHDPESGPVTLPELAATRAQLLVFVNCYCASTSEAAAAIEAWQGRLGLVDVHLVFSVALAPWADNRPTPPGTLVDHAGLTWAALGLTPESPTAVLLGADGYLAGGPVSGTEAVKDFVDDIEESLRELPELAEVADSPR
ncbi:MAG: MauE/DoxX family redox-associated membrane protein [Knoellia sp.]